MTKSEFNAIYDTILDTLEWAGLQTEENEDGTITVSDGGQSVKLTIEQP